MRIGLLQLLFQCFTSPSLKRLKQVKHPPTITTSPTSTTITTNFSFENQQIILLSLYKPIYLPRRTRFGTVR